MITRLLIVPLLLLAAATAAANVDSEMESRSLEFDVYLDDSKIGWHRFDITQAENGVREVSSRANFDVKFLFITAFRYRHENEERWNNGCLAEIDASTNSNGKQTSVSGLRSDDSFVLENGTEIAELPRCVMTFAYWNPEFLEQARLLNPQTGEYLEVAVNRLEAQQIKVNGRTVMATPYAISARGVEVTVWYSQDDEWLALESRVKGDRKIRYELS